MISAVRPLNLHHLGWVVRSIEASQSRFVSAPLLADLGIEDYGWVRVAFLQAGCSLIELLEPQDSSSDLGEFLAERGEGIHHVAYGVADVAEALAEVRSRGLRVLDEEPRPGARDTRIAFVDPQLPGGVLVELVEDPQLDVVAAHHASSAT